MVRHWENLSAVMGLLLLFAAGMVVRPAQAGDGRFEVRSAHSRLESGVYYATARIDYRLSKEVIDALDSGITLTIQLQIEISRVRHFFPDENIASLVQDYELSYQPLTQQYVVKNLNRGSRSAHLTLFSALRFMGKVSDLPVIDAALLQPGQRYQIEIRAVLD